MKDYVLLQKGRLIDKRQGYHGVCKDILIHQGRILEIKECIEPTENMEVIALDNQFVSAGFIDIHTHVFPKAKTLGIEPDSAGVETGVTCICDAGSAGPLNIAEFIETCILPSRTRIYSEMHFSKYGLVELPEADCKDKYDLKLAENAYAQYQPYIVAIKARASNSTVGALGIEPIQDAKRLAERLQLPLYVHIGNLPPRIEEVLAVMKQGDIITHAFHGKKNGLFPDGKILPEAQAARNCNVLFDVGHGVASFSFKTAKVAFANGFWPDLISTDLHKQNINGPVYSLATTMSKMMALGISLEDCVDKVTAAPAEAFHLTDIGQLKAGMLADITVFKLEKKNTAYSDADGNLLEGTEAIEPDFCLVEGKKYLRTR